MKSIKLYIAIIPLSLCAIITAVSAIAYNNSLFVLLLLATTLCIIGAVVWLFVFDKALQKDIDAIFSENSVVSRQIISSIGVPCLFCNISGQIAWKNIAFGDIFDGKNMKKLLTSDELTSMGTFEKIINEKHYIVHLMPVVRSNRRASSMLFIYFEDRTDVFRFMKLYTDNYPIVALIYVDNYEDIGGAKDLARGGAVINEIEREISKMALSVDGIYSRLEGARFVLMFEAKNLNALEEKRFEILNTVRAIHTDNEQTVTISVAVGHDDSTAKSYTAAQSAMELALGRGGDQAVVKHGSTYKFYGGKTISTTKVSRVKARSVAGALRGLMNNSTEVFIMGHKNADMDCVGAALGLIRCAMSLNAKAFFVIDGGCDSVETLLNTKLPKHLSDAIISPITALETIKKTSLLIIVDTQRENLLCSVDLYHAATNVAIIDHHRRSADAMSQTSLSYLEAGASSASELVTEIMQCLCESKMNIPVEANALLSGICLDTKYFVFNTGIRTFEAAGYLRKCGADPGYVKRMFQDDMTTFATRASIVERASLLSNGVAVSTCENITDSQVLAAQAADTLITIKGIGASFVLSDMGGAVWVSARSLGTINVQRICERMGGGGHLAVAGAQLPNVTIDEALVILKSSIDDYFKEETNS